MGATAIADLNTAELGGFDPQHELTVLATVAHELRGPLTALATSSELLAEDFLQLDPAQVQDMLAAMHRRTLWLQGLVENLLCAATIREGRLHAVPAVTHDRRRAERRASRGRAAARSARTGAAHSRHAQAARDAGRQPAAGAGAGQPDPERQQVWAAELRYRDRRDPQG